MKSTLENNRTIDTFMESKGHYTSHKDCYGGEVWGEYNPNPYQSDWNLLMEVVEKIENLHEANNVLIGTNLTYIQIHNKAINEQETFKGVGKAKIEAVYNAVVAFIEWYNSAEKE